MVRLRGARLRQDAAVPSDDALSTTSPAGPIDDARYGPDIPTEADLRLLGDMSGRRVLELGCGAEPSAIAFAKQGAVAIALDTSAERLALARRRCEREGARVELHHADLADLAFVRAESIDVVFSALAFATVSDLNRLFRQIHRVLKGNGTLAFSIRHPSMHLVDPYSEQPLVVRRSYYDRAVRQPEGNGEAEHHHTLADLFTGLTRARCRVDAVLEPEPVPGAPRSPHWREVYRYVPSTLILRARKDGL